MKTFLKILIFSILALAAFARQAPRKFIKNKIRRIKPSYLLLLLLIHNYCHAMNRIGPPTRYVKQTAAGLGDGSSWANASGDLQTTINSAPFGANVWVAAGTYKPNAYPVGCVGCSSNRDWVFVIKNGVNIYGGFTGTGPNPDAILSTNETVLSGEINTPNVSDNVYHVLMAVDISTPTVLDKLTIRAGNANINSQITVAGQTLYRVWGGGLLSASSPFLRFNAVAFVQNYAESGAGILNTNGSSITLYNCLFTQNLAGNGGAIYNHNNSSPGISNCTFANNIATAVGGAIYNYNLSNPIISNCIIWGNTAPMLPQIADNSSTPSVYYSIVEGGVSGCNFCPNTNGNSNPQFTNILDPDGSDNIPRTIDDGLRLVHSSPAINTGSNGEVSVYDILGLYLEGIRDLGAYEFMPKERCILHRFVSENPIESGTHISFIEIVSIGTVGSATNVSFESAYKITLLPGFKTETNAVFVARIHDNCGF